MDDGKFTRHVEDTLRHTAEYAANPEFRRHWLGFTEESRNLRAQMWRAFGKLIGSVTPSLAGWRILDVGCGDGRNLRTLLEYDAKPEDVMGIDVSDARFEIGAAKNPLVKLMKTDGVTVPFADEHFDLATQFVCFSNIPGIELRRHVADEISRVVKKGGYMFWWDLFRSTAPTDEGAEIEVSHYFNWPIQKLLVNQHEMPSEALRPLRGLKPVIGKVLDHFCHPPTHVAAIVGPKA